MVSHKNGLMRHSDSSTNQLVVSETDGMCFHALINRFDMGEGTYD